MDKETKKPEDKQRSGVPFDPVVRFAAYSILFCALSAIIVLRYQNMDMSETRLFFEYWYAWLSIIGLCFLSVYLLRIKT